MKWRERKSGCTRALFLIHYKYCHIVGQMSLFISSRILSSLVCCNAVVQSLFWCALKFFMHALIVAADTRPVYTAIRIIILHYHLDPSQTVLPDSKISLPLLPVPSSLAFLSLTSLLTVFHLPFSPSLPFHPQYFTPFLSLPLLSLFPPPCRLEEGGQCEGWTCACRCLRIGSQAVQSTGNKWYVTLQTTPSHFISFLSSLSNTDFLVLYLAKSSFI